MEDHPTINKDREEPTRNHHGTTLAKSKQGVCRTKGAPAPFDGAPALKMTISTSSLQQHGRARAPFGRTRAYFADLFSLFRFHDDLGLV